MHLFFLTQTISLATLASAVAKPMSKWLGVELIVRTLTVKQGSHIPTHYLIVRSVKKFELFEGHFLC